MEERNFELLKELVDSTIQIDKNREASGKEPLVGDFTGLLTLKAMVDEYCSLLGIPEQEDDDLSDFDSCEEMWSNEYD